MDWSDCSLVSSDPEIVHGEPVFTGTRVPVAAVLESVEAYFDEGLSLQGAIEATFLSFPGVPDGVEGIRQIFAYYSSQELQSAA
jgi:uncharacterized protein (DUF433 family)